jgi:hypothetical protein
MVKINLKNPTVTPEGVKMDIKIKFLPSKFMR